MNIDKQIEKIIDKHIIHEEFVIVDEHIEQEWEGDVLVRKDLLVSQIKQSILKAIMEAKPKNEWHSPDHDCGAYECSVSGRNKAIKEFESVIKEILQTKTNEKD